MATHQQLWDDADFMYRVQQARSNLYQLFVLDRDAEHADWVQVVGRITSGSLTEKEKEQAKEISAEFFEDVVEHNLLPRVFSELDYRLYSEFRATIDSLVKEALGQSAGDQTRIQFVTERVHRQLLWRIIRNSRQLWEKNRKNESWLDWLRRLAAEFAFRIGRPSPVFRDFPLLKEVGEACKKYFKELELTGHARNISRQKIEEARRKAAEQRRSGRTSETAVQGDLLPLPEPIQKLVTMLMDPDVSPDLHVALRGHIDREVEGRAEFADDSQFKKRQKIKDDAFQEFLDLIVWRIIKMAKEWYETTIEGATTWAWRVFTKLSKDAWKTVNYAMNKAARGHGGRPYVFYDDVALAEISAPEANTPGNEPDVLSAVRQLPDDLRIPLCLSVGIDPATMQSCPRRSFDEISATLGIEEKVVKKNVRLAKGRLVEIMEQE